MNGYDRTYVNIDLTKIRANLLEAKKRVRMCMPKKDVKLLAVIKADGYGHGAKQIAAHVEDIVSFFGVATIDEAMALYDAKIRVPILILGYISDKEYEVAIEHDIRLCVSTYEEGVALSKTAKRMGKKAYLHIKLDTGMTRLGFDACEESVDKIKALYENEDLVVEGIFTHFSCADMYDETYTNRQIRLFWDFDKKLNEKGVSGLIHHTCNSAGIMRYASNEDMVRSGIITYGMYPSDEVDKRLLKLSPALSWYAHVTHIRKIDKGVAISYGATYVSEKPMKIATVSVGYADGYPRALSSKGYVLIHGKKANIVGRVCMDQLIVDISDFNEEVKIEDLVTLIGTDPTVTDSDLITVEEIAALAGTFNYEFVCNISVRVPRRYIGKKEEICLD